MVVVEEEEEKEGEELTLEEDPRLATAQGKTKAPPEHLFYERPFVGRVRF